MAIESGPIERKRGDTYADEFQVMSKATDAVIDITIGYSFRLTVDPAKNPTDATNNVYALVGAVTDGANGLVEFAPTLSQADQLGSFYYDLEMTDPSGRIRTIEKDKYKYVQDISK